MEEELEMVFDMAKESMDDAINHLVKELSKIRAGKATPRMMDGIMVDYYGTMTPLNQVANINTPDARYDFDSALGKANARAYLSGLSSIQIWA